MSPFASLFLIGLLLVQASLGLEFLDCKCYAHENDYRIIGGKPSTELFPEDHSMNFINQAFLSKTTPKLQVKISPRWVLFLGRFPFNRGGNGTGFICRTTIKLASMCKQNSEIRSLQLRLLIAFPDWSSSRCGGEPLSIILNWQLNLEDLHFDEQTVRFSLARFHNTFPLCDERGPLVSCSPLRCFQGELSLLTQNQLFP